MDGSLDAMLGRPQKRAAGPPEELQPGPPKRYKSSYLCFAVANHDKVKEEIGKGARVGDISKRMAQKWKKLSNEERKQWEDEAKTDRARYEDEKANYTGPIDMSRQRRKKKDPSAPKRPMSAFLSFSQKYRTDIKTGEPDMKNTDVSKRLGEMWRNAPEDERNMYIEQEARQRAQYKIDMAEWKKQHAAEMKLKRKEEKAQKAKEKKDNKQRKKEEKAKKDLSDALTGAGRKVHNDQDLFASRFRNGSAGSHGRGTYDSCEGDAGPGQSLAGHHPLLAYMQNRCRSLAGLDWFLQSPYLESAYGSLGSMGTAGIEPGLAYPSFGEALRRESYLRGLADFSGLRCGIHSSLHGVGMGTPLPGGDVDASLLHEYGILGYPSVSPPAAQLHLGRMGPGDKKDNIRSVISGPEGSDCGEGD